MQLCAELNEAAAVSEGEVERLVEKEAMALNVAILENRWGWQIGEGRGREGRGWVLWERAARSAVHVEPRAWLSPTCKSV